MASPATYVSRFGGLTEAYELIGYRKSKYTKASVEGRRKLASLRFNVMEQLKQAFVDANLSYSPAGRMIRVRGYGRFSVEIARVFTIWNGQLRWKGKDRHHGQRHRLIVIRLRPGSGSVQDFVVMHRAPSGCKYFTLSEATLIDTCIVCSTAADVAVAIVSETTTITGSP